MFFWQRQRYYRDRERVRWEGFRDALVHGARNPGKYEFGGDAAERPGYMAGFDEGIRAVKQIRLDGLISEVRRLSLKPGDKLVFKCAEKLNGEMVERIQADLGSQFPDHEILVLDSDMDISVAQSMTPPSPPPPTPGLGRPETQGRRSRSDRP